MDLLSLVAQITTKNKRWKAKFYSAELKKNCPYLNN